MPGVGTFNQERVGSWKEGKLVFRSYPLKQALVEIARYRPEELRLLDPTLTECPVSGVFNIQGLDHAIDTLQAALPIRAQRVRDDLIYIERALALSPASMSHREILSPAD
jgi:transmembrane sensor